MARSRPHFFTTPCHSPIAPKKIDGTAGSILLPVALFRRATSNASRDGGRGAARKGYLKAFLWLFYLIYFNGPAFAGRFQGRFQHALGLVGVFKIGERHGGRLAGKRF